MCAYLCLKWCANGKVFNTATRWTDTMVAKCYVCNIYKMDILCMFLFYVRFICDRYDNHEKLYMKLLCLWCDTIKPYSLIAVFSSFAIAEMKKYIKMNDLWNINILCNIHIDLYNITSWVNPTLLGYPTSAAILNFQYGFWRPKLFRIWSIAF